LKGLQFVGERLLEVEEGARSLPSAGVPEGCDPDIGGVEVPQEICSLVGADRGERGGGGETAVL
jgi:hypothetical protein